jgi:Domain of unknown function (DUF4326)
MTKVVRVRKGKDGNVNFDIYIGRKCDRGGWDLKESKWHNPYSVSSCGGSAQLAVEKFKTYILNKPTLLQDLHELKDKRLGCWCKNKGHEPCHGDVLLELLLRNQSSETSSSSSSSSVAKKANGLLFFSL